MLQLIKSESNFHWFWGQQLWKEANRSNSMREQCVSRPLFILLTMATSPHLQLLAIQLRVLTQCPPTEAECNRWTACESTMRIDCRWQSLQNLQIDKQTWFPGKYSADSVCSWCYYWNLDVPLPALLSDFQSLGVLPEHPAMVSAGPEWEERLCEIWRWIKNDQDMWQNLYCI